MAKKTNFGGIALVLIALALTAWIALLILRPAPGPAYATPKEARFASAAQSGAAYNESFFAYNDSKWGFAINYPIGFDAALEPEEGVYLRFRASAIAVAIATPLSIDLSLTRAKTARELRDDAIRDFKAAGATRITQEEQTIEGKKVYFLEAEGKNVLAEENMLYRFAFYSCRDPKGGDYFASLSASMPLDLLPELKFVDYILYSFKC